MFIANQDTFDFATATTAPTRAMPLGPDAAERRPRAMTGLSAGTVVETDRGFYDIADVITGMKFHTLDGGLAELTGISRTTVSNARTLAVRIASGTLDNDAALTLPATQHLLIETHEHEDVVGAPFALVRAGALVGLEGIAPSAIRQGNLITPTFEDEEVIYAQSGTMVHCPSRTTLGAAEFYPTLDDTFARSVMAERLSRS